jgi:hypothetical protein
MSRVATLAPAASAVAAISASNPSIGVPANPCEHNPGIAKRGGGPERQYASGELLCENSLGG